jgi:hypothetical protein
MLRSSNMPTIDEMLDFDEGAAICDECDSDNLTFFADQPDLWDEPGHVEGWLCNDCDHFMPDP